MVFNHVIRQPCWCTEQWQIWLIFCTKIESNSQDFSLFCSVHQHGSNDVGWKPPILKWIIIIYSYRNCNFLHESILILAETLAWKLCRYRPLSKWWCILLLIYVFVLIRHTGLTLVWIFFCKNFAHRSEIKNSLFCSAHSFEYKSNTTIIFKLQVQSYLQRTCLQK